MLTCFEPGRVLYALSYASPSALPTFFRLTPFASSSASYACKIHRQTTQMWKKLTCAVFRDSSSFSSRFLFCSEFALPPKSSTPLFDVSPLIGCALPCTLSWVPCNGSVLSPVRRVWSPQRFSSFSPVSFMPWQAWRARSLLEVRPWVAKGLRKWLSRRSQHGILWAMAWGMSGSSCRQATLVVLTAMPYR